MSRHGKIAKTKSYLSVVIDADLKEELRKLAEEDERTLSKFIVKELRNVVREKIASCNLKSNIKARPPDGQSQIGAGPTYSVSKFA